MQGKPGQEGHADSRLQGHAGDGTTRLRSQRVLEITFGPHLEEWWSAERESEEFANWRKSTHRMNAVHGQRTCSAG